METMKQYGAWNDKKPSNEEIAKITQEIVKAKETLEHREEERKAAIEKEKIRIK